LPSTPEPPVIVSRPPDPAEFARYRPGTPTTRLIRRSPRSL
jgi:hypothetical protein